MPSTGRILDNWWCLQEGTKQFQASFYEWQKDEIDHQWRGPLVPHLTSKDFTVDQVDKKERKRNAPLPRLQPCRWMRLTKSISVLERPWWWLNSSGRINIGSRCARFDYCVQTRHQSWLRMKLTSYINDRFGSKYSKHGSKVKECYSAQDAHEAIRPSSVFNTQKASLSTWTKTSSRLLCLIWNRFVASQMTGAIFDTMAISKWSSVCGKWEAKLSLMVILLIYNDSDKNKCLLEYGCWKIMVKQVNSKPEQHCSLNRQLAIQATLIKTLEENGVGRPSSMLRRDYPKTLLRSSWQLNVLNQQSWEDCQ